MYERINRFLTHLNSSEAQQIYIGSIPIVYSPFLSVKPTFLSVNELIVIRGAGLTKSYPVDTRYLYNIFTMLDKRRRRWADVVQMLYKCFGFRSDVLGLLRLRKSCWQIICNQSSYSNITPTTFVVGSPRLHLSC